MSNTGRDKRRHPEYLKQKSVNLKMQRSATQNKDAPVADIDK